MQHTSQMYGNAVGTHLRNKSGEKHLVKDGGPIDIFVDLDSNQDPNAVLMKSPSNASAMHQPMTS